MASAAKDLSLPDLESMPAPSKTPDTSASERNTSVLSSPNATPENSFKAKPTKNEAVFSSPLPNAHSKSSLLAALARLSFEQQPSPNGASRAVSPDSPVTRNSKYFEDSSSELFVLTSRSHLRWRCALTLLQSSRGGSFSDDTYPLSSSSSSSSSPFPITNVPPTAVLELVLYRGPDGSIALHNVLINDAPKHLVAAIMAVEKLDPERRRQGAMTDAWGRTPLHAAAMEGRDLDILKMTVGMFPLALLLDDFEGKSPLEVIRSNFMFRPKHAEFVSFMAENTMTVVQSLEAAPLEDEHGMTVLKYVSAYNASVRSASYPTSQSRRAESLLLLSRMLRLYDQLLGVVPAAPARRRLSFQGLLFGARPNHREMTAVATDALDRINALVVQETRPISSPPSSSYYNRRNEADYTRKEADEPTTREIAVASQVVHDDLRRDEE